MEYCSSFCTKHRQSERSVLQTNDCVSRYILNHARVGEGRATAWSLFCLKLCMNIEMSSLNFRRKRSKSRSPFKKEKSPIRWEAKSHYCCLCWRTRCLNLPFIFSNDPFLSTRQPIDNLTPEERDARTVFCMQLAARIRARDLEDFFSAVGKVSCFSLPCGINRVQTPSLTLPCILLHR